MNDVDFVNVVDSFYDLDKDSKGILQFEYFIGLGELIRVQITEFAVFHDQEEVIIYLEFPEQFDDMWVLDDFHVTDFWG